MFKKTALKRLLECWKKGCFDVQYWDGETETIGSGKPSFKIIFTRAPELKDVRTDVTLMLGEAYMEGILDFEGNLDDIIHTMFQNSKDDLPLDIKKKYNFKELEKELKNGIEVEESKNIHSHYDLGNDFFSLWLDKTMSYSCAYFKTETDSLHTAQINKIDHSLKKLKLKKGDRLLDIGCGWGDLVIRAAQQYGVHTVGITLSMEQYNGARQRIAQLGLTELCDIRLINYLDMNPKAEQFDRIISIGMLEHVGKNFLPLYLYKVNRLLKPQGLFLLHSITGFTESPSNSWIRKYIFPGGYVPTEKETIALLPDFDFHLLHMESLRLHYARTLDCWYTNFQQHELEITKMYGTKFVRMWALYLQGCAAAFRIGSIDVCQYLLSKNICNNLPATFSYMYDK